MEKIKWDYPGHTTIQFLSKILEDFGKIKWDLQLNTSVKFNNTKYGKIKWDLPQNTTFKNIVRKLENILWGGIYYEGKLQGGQLKISTKW